MNVSIQEHYKRWGFFRDLILNNIEDKKNNTLLTEYYIENDEPLYNNVFVILIDNYHFLMNNNQEKSKEEIRFDIYEKIATAIRKRYNAIPAAIENNIFALLIQNKEGENSSASHLLDLGIYLRNYVEENSGLKVSIGIGRSYTKLEDLFLSYQEAIKSLESRFYLGSSQVIHYENISPYSKEGVFLSIDNHFRLLTNTIACNLEEAISIVDEIISIAAAKKINPFLVKVRFCDSLIDIINQSNIYEKINLDIELKEISDRLFNTDNIFELKTQLQICLEEIINTINISRKNINLQIFEDALSFIHTNFNRNISLEDVAKDVYVSPYYISHGFKEYIGMSFCEYLKVIRIEEAKKLLLTTDLSIRRISKNIGYSDPNYFSRVFKSVVGVSPSAFCIKNPRQNQIS